MKDVHNRCASVLLSLVALFLVHAVAGAESLPVLATGGSGTANAVGVLVDKGLLTPDIGSGPRVGPATIELPFVMHGSPVGVLGQFELGGERVFEFVISGAGILGLDLFGDARGNWFLRSESFEFSPAVEPGTLLLLGAGLVGLSCAVWWKRRRH